MRRKNTEVYSIGNLRYFFKQGFLSIIYGNSNKRTAF